MYKKTLLSLAVASSLALTGCFESSSDSRNAGATTDGDKIGLSEKAFREQFEGKTWPVFNPAAGNLPIPNDLIFSDVGDGSFEVDDTQPPVTTALNRLSGASTVAPIDIEFNGRLKASTVVGPRNAQGDENPGVPLSQTVFLIELDYASGAPLQALSLGEGPGGETGLFQSIEVGVEEYINSSGTTTDYIRITPMEPLNPNKRYIAVVTNEVQTQDGEAISRSPDYANLGSERDIPSPLQGARSLVQFWETVADNVFNTPNENLPGGASLSEARQAEPLELPPLNKDSIALSYSFTTSNDVAVLRYIANPELWFQDQIRNFVRTGAVESLSAQQRQDYETAKTAADQANENFEAATLSEDLAGACGDFDEGEAQIQCAAVALSNSDGISQLLPDVTAAAESAQVDFDNALPAPLKSAVLNQIPDASDVAIAEGQISLPYYLDAPIEKEATERGFWTANTQLAGALNSAFEDAGLELPQGTGASDVVNSVFPFPEQTADITVPMLTIFPSGADLTDAGEELPVVIYQHGITTDRSAALTFGTALAANGIAVIAIDQPLHGVSPFSSAEQTGLASQLLQAGPFDNTEANREALIDDTLAVSHLIQEIDPACDDISVDPTDPASIQQAIQQVLGEACEGERAGSAMELGFALGAQSAVINAGSTIPGIAPASKESGFDPDGINERHFGIGEDPEECAVADMNFDKENPVGSSGDLFINLENFTNNRDIFRQGAVDQMHLRASIGNIAPAFDAENVYFVGHSLGTINGGAFVAAANASGRDDIAIKGANLLTPVAGITRMLENSPSFGPTIVGGLEDQGLSQNMAGYQTFLNVIQHGLDSVDAINLTSDLDNVIASQIDGDQTVINDAREQLSGTFDGEVNCEITDVDVDSSRGPLSGSQPFAEILDANRFDASNSLVSDGPLDLPAFVRFLNVDGVFEPTHGTPVSADPAATFGEMVAQTLLLINLDEKAAASDEPSNQSINPDD